MLTHAHLDHSGYLPRLIAEGFDGPVYATPGTIELTRIVLPDCGHLNEEEAEYANRKGFSRAGHILGAASVEVELGDNGPAVVVSGDLGRSQHPLLVPPDPPPPFGDCLLVESTYGNRHHDDAGSLDKLAGAIVATIHRGGSVLIPAFAVDRTEVLLHHFSSLSRSGLTAVMPAFGERVRVGD